MGNYKSIWNSVVAPSARNDIHGKQKNDNIIMFSKQQKAKIVVKEVQIDTNRAELIVFGFIRLSYEILNYSNSLNKIVPHPLKLIIIAYHGDNEYWEYFNEEHIKFEAINNIIKAIEEKRSAICGHISVNISNKIICLWTLKLLKCDDYDIFIGLINDRKANDHCNFGSLLCAYGNNGRFISEHRTNIDHRYGDCYKAGDIIKMELNCVDKKIRYFVNDNDMGWKNIKNSLTNTRIPIERVRLAVSLYAIHDAIQIIGYKVLKYPTI